METVPAGDDRSEFTLPNYANVFQTHPMETYAESVYEGTG